MDDPTSRTEPLDDEGTGRENVRDFAAHVHEIVDLHEHGAPPPDVERFMHGLEADLDEAVALRMLSSSLHDTPAPRGGRAGSTR